MTPWKRKNYGDNKKISGWGWGGMNRWSAEDFQSSETTLQDAIKVGTCHYTFVKTRRTYNTKKNPNINYGLWIIMCQCRFIDCNKCTTLVGDFDSEGGWG